MTVYKVLAEMAEAMRTSHLEHEDIRREMKSEFGTVKAQLRKLGLEFEAFRHDTKITLDMLSELMTETARQGKHIQTLDRRTGRVDDHLRLKPLPDLGDG